MVCTFKILSMYVVLLKSQHPIIAIHNVSIPVSLSYVLRYDDVSIYHPISNTLPLILRFQYERLSKFYCLQLNLLSNVYIVWAGAHANIVTFERSLNFSNIRQ